MAKLFSDFLDECELVLNDPSDSVWSRAMLIAWAKEAFLALPILRPQEYGYNIVADLLHVELPADFREVISVEYPIDQIPPTYLNRMNMRDEAYYDRDDNYDIDRNYVDGMGWTIWCSGGWANGTSVRIHYLANHDTDLADAPANYITVPDEYVYLCVQYVVMLAFEERLSTFMQNPTAYSGIIAQMVDSAKHASDLYLKLMSEALSRQNLSRPTPKYKVDNHDRVY